MLYSWSGLADILEKSWIIIMNILMPFWIWFRVCIGCTVMACVESMDKKRNLIRIVPLTVSIQDAEVLGNHNQAFR